MAKTRKKIGEIVYDGSIEVSVKGGDCPAIQEIKSSRGKWPHCLEPDPFGDDKISLLRAVPLDPPYGEKECNCGKHIMFWLRPPKKIWPDLEMALVRVFKKK